MIDLPRRLILVLKNSSSSTQYRSHCRRSPSLTGIASSSSSCVSPYASPCAISSLSSGPVPANSCLTPGGRRELIV